jgi:hypothetical protein
MDGGVANRVHPDSVVSGQPWAEKGELGWLLPMAVSPLGVIAIDGLLARQGPSVASIRPEDTWVRSPVSPTRRVPPSAAAIVART